MVSWRVSPLEELEVAASEKPIDSGFKTKASARAGLKEKSGDYFSGK